MNDINVKCNNYFFSFWQNSCEKYNNYNKAIWLLNVIFLNSIKDLMNAIFF